MIGDPESRKPKYTFTITFGGDYYSQYNRILTHVMKGDELIPTPHVMRCDYHTSEFIWRDLGQHRACYLLHVIGGLNLAHAHYGVQKQ